MQSQIALVGFLGKAAESKKTENNKLMTRFQLAVKVWGKDQPAWVPILCWEKTAEIARELVSGQKVVVLGELDHFSVGDRQVLSVVARSIVVVPKEAPKPEEQAADGGWG